MALPYYPAYGYPYQPTMIQSYQQAQQNNGIIWVQGVEAMKSYPVSAGQSVLLMDSETNCFGIKTADASGMPLPLRIFDYTERTANNAPKTAQETHTEPQIDLSAYVTRDELESRISEVLAVRRNAENNNRNDRKDGQNNGK